MLCYQDVEYIENMISVEYFDRYDLDKSMMIKYIADEMLSIDDVEHVRQV